MALVSGRGSGLNPNARPYIPTVYRQVEDFSSEWWNLVQNSPWFRDYWMTERQEATVDKSDAKDDDITNLLPDTFDVEYDDFNNEEAEFYEFIGSSDYHGGRGSGAQVKPQNVAAVDATSLIKNINMNSMSAKGRGPTTNYLREQPKYHDRPGQHMSYNHGVRRIHQPR